VILPFPLLRCVVCQIRADNSAAIPVRSYSIVRSLTVSPRRQSSHSFGTILLCDRCVRDLAKTRRSRQVGHI